MADLIHNRWYQSSSVLGGYSTAGFRAPASHAMDGDKTRLAISEDSEWEKGMIEVAEKLKKLAETLEESRDQILDRLDQIQDRMLDGLAQFQQRLSQRFQISSKMAVEEQPPSLEKEEFTIDVDGGQDLEKKGVQVIELELEEEELSSNSVRKEKYENQQSIKHTVLNLQGSRGSSSRGGGGGDFAGGFVGGGSLDNLVGINGGVAGWSTSVGNHQTLVVHLQWEPGGWFESPLIKQMEADLKRRERGGVIVTDTRWSRLRGGGDFAGGFTGGGPSVPADTYRVEMMVSNQLWLAETRYPEIGGKKRRVTGEDTCAGKFEGNVHGKSLKMKEGRGGERRSDYCGTVGSLGKYVSNCRSKVAGDSCGSVARWRFSEGLQWQLPEARLRIDGSKLSRALEKIPEEDFSSSPDIIPDVINPGPHPLANSTFSLHSSRFFFPGKELRQVLGPTHFNHGQFNYRPSTIDEVLSNINHNIPLTKGERPSPISTLYSLGFYSSNPYKRPNHYLPQSSYTSRPSIHFLKPFNSLNYDSQLIYLYQSSPPQKPPSTTVILQPILSNLLHNLKQNQPLNHGSTFPRPDHITVATHLEDKVDVWAAGSGKYGGVDGVVNGAAGIGYFQGTPYNFKDGWHDHVPWRLLHYWSSCIETFAVWFTVPGINHSFFILVVALERVRSLMVQTQNLVTFDKNLGDFCFFGYSGSILLKLEFEGTFSEEDVIQRLDLGFKGNFICTSGTTSSCCSLKATAMSSLILKR